MVARGVAAWMCFVLHVVSAGVGGWKFARCGLAGVVRAGWVVCVVLPEEAVAEVRGPGDVVGDGFGVGVIEVELVEFSDAIDGSEAKFGTEAVVVGDEGGGAGDGDGAAGGVDFGDGEVGVGAEGDGGELAAKADGGAVLGVAGLAPQYIFSEALVTYTPPPSPLAAEL